MKYYFYGYIIISVIASIIICYYRGPFENSRSIDILQYLLKLIGICCLHLSISFNEMSYVIILGFLFLKFFQKPRKLISLDSFNKEAQEYTKKQLDELKKFCNSQGSDIWKLVLKNSRPER